MASTAAQTPQFVDDPAIFDQAFAKVKQTFSTGRTKPYNYRMQQLKNLKDGLTKMRPELDRALTQDLGKETFVNWMFEFLLIEREIDHTMANLKDWMEDVCVDTPMAIGPGKSYIQREPLGVVVILGAWNFPFSTALGPMVDAMAAGNTVVLKPSELAPHVAQATELLFKKYLDPNSYQCVNGGVNVAVRATATKSDLIIFTGGTEKGKLVAKAAAENLVPVVLELGGKSPMIVDKSVDLEYAAAKAA